MIRSLVRAPEVQNKLILGTGFSRTMTPDEGPLWVGNYKSDPNGPNVNAIVTLHHIDTNATYVGLWNGPLSARVGAVTLMTGTETIAYLASTVTSATDVVAYNADISPQAATVTTATLYFAQPFAAAAHTATVTNTYNFRSSAPVISGGLLANFTAFRQEASSTDFTGDFKGVFIGAQTGFLGGFYGIDVASTVGEGGSGIIAAARFAQPTGGAANHALWLENSASTQPTMIWRNVAQNTIVITVPGTINANWTLTLPPDDGDATEHLQTNGSGVTTWENPATSFREAKILEGLLDREVALERVRSAPVYLYHYNPDVKHVGGDYRTQFAHIVADEAPWAMRADGKSAAILSELGHLIASVGLLADKVDALEAKVA